MPTVFRDAGFRFVIRFAPREHGPAHVHVFKGGAEVVIELTDPPALRACFGMNLTDVREAVVLTHTHRILLLDAWERIHGA